jgi:phosphatidylcholine synthase
MPKLKSPKRSRPIRARHSSSPSVLRVFLGWCVHAYTGLGLVAAGLIAVSLVRGGPAEFRWSFILMLVATIIDASDGTLARKVRIKEAVPSFDGRRLDDIIDFLTYTFLPLLLIWRAEILPAGFEPVLFLPLLASAYGFCQVEAKTSDGYFLGFPSLWNVVAFYVYLIDLCAPVTGPWISLVIVIVLAILTFVPTRHLYPSLPGKLNRVATFLGIPWGVVMLWVLWELPTQAGEPLDGLTQTIAWATMSYPAFYLGASWWVSIRHWKSKHLYTASGSSL